ncbi:DoxX family protein [Cytophagaceae bacterium ABcell3]|nr:DoxX family protein [Cytophagaceae bacterium ABcell3]
MGFTRRGDKFAQEHPFAIFAVLRVLLGVILLVKGVFFLSNTDAITSLISSGEIRWGAVFLAHYIALVHIAGGLLIAAGALTRVAILFQLPILIGALFVGEGPLGMVSEWYLALIVLIGALFFLYYGSGVHSFRTKLEQEQRYNEHYYS